MKIDELLNRYFDGDTTCEEEREIKRFFREENIPEEFEVYRPIFAFIEEETKQHSKPAEEENESFKRGRRYFIHTLSSIAAGLLIILSIAGIKHIHQPDNYVIIDGYKSTDIQLAREQALAAFDDVSFSQEDIFDSLFSE